MPKMPPICSPVPKGDPDACLVVTPPCACALLHGSLCVSMLSGLSFRNLVKKKIPFPSTQSLQGCGSARPPWLLRSLKEIKSFTA